MSIYTWILVGAAVVLIVVALVLKKGKSS